MRKLTVDMDVAEVHGIKTAVTLAAISDKIERDLKDDFLKSCYHIAKFVRISTAELSFLTTLSDSELRSCLSKLEEAKIIETKLIGCPPIKHYKILKE